MAVASGAPKMIAQANSPEGINCEEELGTSSVAPLVFSKVKNEARWSFTVTTSLTGPKGFEKKFSRVDSSLAQDLNNVIQSKYNTHQDRLSAVSQLCQNKSEAERIQLGSHLAGKLSTIYDYDRVSGDKVRPEDQWEALYSKDAQYNYNSASGVCRDATFTLAQFMVACGFAKNQVAIQSYETTGGGHQVVTIRDSQGKLYTINWSELYTVDEKGGVASDLNPSNINTGLDYYTYDADGKLVAFRRTELGNIIRAVSGGSIDDNDYHPHLLRLEANYGKFSGSLFKADTTSGESASGVGLKYRSTADDEPYVYSIGTSYTKNKKDVATNPTKLEIEQNILYFQVEAGVRPKLEFNPTSDTHLIITPSVLASAEVYRTSSVIDDEKTYVEMEKNATSKFGLEAEFRKGKLTTWAGASADLALQNTGNNEVNEKYSPVIINTKNISAGASYNGENYVIAGDINARYSYFENSYSVSSSILDKKRDASASIMYKVYDRGSGFREDYIMVGGEKNFSFERVNRVSLGGQAQIPVGDNPHDPTYLATIKFKH